MGGLDIHHIATGSGVSTLVIGPDGSSLMIDAGASKPSADALPPYPSAARRPGEWIGRYARRQLESAGLTPRLDYGLVSHLHPDHLGDLTADAPLAPGGSFRLTGIADVAAQLPIGLIVDRAYPGYDLPMVDRAGAGPAPVAPFLANYIAFIRDRVAKGGRVERFHVGAADQFKPFDIRNLAANGQVWTGEGTKVRAVFPPMAKLRAADLPEENVWSAAIRLRMGRFGYFTAGDLTTNDFDGGLPWRNVETPAARACGPVSVAVAAHHGMFDATSADVVRALRPRTWIVPSWHSAHPSMDTMERMFSTRLYPGPRDLFATGVTAANLTVNRRLIERFASSAGHVVVRVEPGGARYWVMVTDNTDEADRIKAVFGPFDS